MIIKMKGKSINNIWKPKKEKKNILDKKYKKTVSERKKGREREKNKWKERRKGRKRKTERDK